MSSKASFDAKVVKVRDQIEKLKAEITSVEDAPIPMEVALERVDRNLDVYAERCKIKAPEFTGPSWSPVQLINVNDDPIAILAFMAKFLRPQVREGLVSMVQAHYQQHEAGEDLAARSDRTEALADKLFKLEVEEERHIMQAEEAGFDIPRRADADPAAILEA